MTTFLSVLSISLILGAYALCPHETPGLKSWKDAASWPEGKPTENEDVVISGHMLLDESPPELHNLIITSTGRLVFDPTSPLVLRAHNIFVNGSMEIGSEDCLYSNTLNIILEGTRLSHEGEENPKAILVNVGGSLEIHGERKLSWTKLNGTQGPGGNNNDNDVLFDHMTFDPQNTDLQVDSWVDIYYANGLAAYTISLGDDMRPRIKLFAAYDLVKDGSKLAQQIDEVQDGEILMLALQRRFNLKNSRSEQFQTFDALEKLMYGEITYTSKLRRVSKRDSYAFVFQKGSNPQLLSEEVGRLGQTTIASIIKNGYSISAESVSSEDGNKMNDNFRITSTKSMFPIIDVIDDVTTWNPGDTVVFASTDYSWDQAEEKQLVQCDDCSSKQFRIDSSLEYVHWGEFMHEAVDMRAEVGLLTRTVVIEGRVLSSCPSYNGNCKKRQVRDLDTFGGQILVWEGFTGVHIEGVELKHMGQQTDNGRYPIHFHMCLDSDSNPYIKDSTIHNSFARCVTIHGSHDIQVADNFCYNHMGHGFFLEDGAEKNNTFDGNLVMTTRFGTGFEPLDKTNPASFWITNPNTRFINNVAAGGEGTGAWFIYPDQPLPMSRALKQMDEFEARRTPIKEFYNNVGHSNEWIGIIFGSRLGDNRKPVPGNFWQPRVNPKDPASEPLEFILEKITGYKNRRNNVWVEAGMVTVTRVSSSDSLNGITVTNDGLVDEFTGQLTNSVVVGDSSNIGVPSTIPARSIPLELKVEEPHSGLTLWKGPTRISNVWFGGLFYSRHYDIGAIAMKRFSPYFFSVQTSLTNMLFSFDDKDNGNSRAVSGLEGQDFGWKSRDGAHMAGFTLNNNETAFQKPTYIVRPDHLSAAADDCRIREDWRFAICTTKYGNLKVLSSKPTTFVLHNLPAAELWFSGSGNGGPQVVLDGSRVYTVHFENNIPSKVIFTGEGMEIGDTLTIGVCLPRGASFELKSKTPNTIKPEDFVEVASLDELSAPSALDGRKIYYDQKSGMLYYKFIDTRVKPDDAMHPCKDGLCPDLVIDNIKGDKTDADCRRRIYSKEDRDKRLPSQPVFSGVIPKNSGPTPLEGWGAGSTRPFTSRPAVDGGFGNWSAWSACSLTCGEGVIVRRRKCNNPIPYNGGKPCEGDYTETQPCEENQCPVDGDFSEWSEWSDCVLYPGSTCQGCANRTRTCTDPEPQNDGFGCEGSFAEIKRCNICTK